VGVRTSDAWGIGGGAAYKIDLSAIGNKSYLELYALFGFGATNFSTSTDLGTITGFESAFVAKNPAFTGTLIDAGNAIQKQRRYRAGGFFVWNPNPIFSLGIWCFWQQDSAGFRTFGNQGVGTPFIEAAGTRNLYEAGFRPYLWIADNIAIQGQVFGSYQDNVRGFQGTSAYGRSGSMGVFTIAPTIKPKGAILLVRSCVSLPPMRSGAIPYGALLLRSRKVATPADSVLRPMPIPGLTMGGCLGHKWSGISKATVPVAP